MKTYGDYLEISDFAILNYINYPGECQWNNEIERGIEDFEKRFKIEVFTLGRSGRHICVEDTPQNRKRWNSMFNWLDKWHFKMMKKYKWSNE